MATAFTDRSLLGRAAIIVASLLIMIVLPALGVGALSALGSHADFWSSAIRGGSLHHRRRRVYD